MNAGQLKKCLALWPDDADVRFQIGDTGKSLICIPVVEVHLCGDAVVLMPSDQNVRAMVSSVLDVEELKKQVTELEAEVEQVKTDAYYEAKGEDW